ncbi:hypothetical protein A2U01_0038833 [Trifolium medium]|uniref:Uncharacterized protein n=1 Tax=Trifolium medium TaxID=97028 RepID=A0A392PZV9_9FABA|nr:hypothetical protein [Trifolium medium]
MCNSKNRGERGSTPHDSDDDGSSHTNTMLRKQMRLNRKPSPQEAGFLLPFNETLASPSRSFRSMDPKISHPKSIKKTIKTRIV